MKVLFFILVACFSAACDQASDISKSLPGREQLDSAMHEAGKLYDQTIQPGAESAQKGATEELEKLFRFEYKVVTLTADQEDDQKLEAYLNQLGQDRWECFSIERMMGELRLYCRRRPKTYLRYIPRWLPF